MKRLRLLKMAVLLGCVLNCLFNWATPTGAAQDVGTAEKRPPVTFKIERDGKTFYGKPLATDGSHLAIVRWDGRLKVFPINDPDVRVSRYRQGFDPYSPLELKRRLEKSFGNRYDVSTTEHFVVIHPKGGKNVWAQPFEDHLQRLNHYFSTHGLKTREPEFPLVAIVLRSRKEFDLQLSREKSYNPNIHGFYSKESNRVTTYAPRGARLTPTGAAKLANWMGSSTTVVHEVAHQFAFNCGVHNRFCAVPKWITEGLAVLCESKGVYNFRASGSLQSRVNQKRLASYRRFREAGKTSGKLLELLQSDRLFETDPELAYALSWAISFYLNENRQADYFRFLEKDAGRREFRDHGKIDRVGFFVRFFGNNIQGLETKMEQFVESL